MKNTLITHKTSALSFRDKEVWERVSSMKYVHRKVAYTWALSFNSEPLTLKIYNCLLTLSLQERGKLAKKKIFAWTGTENRVEANRTLWRLLTVQMIHKYTG